MLVLKDLLILSTIDITPKYFRPILSSRLNWQIFHTRPWHSRHILPSKESFSIPTINIEFTNYNHKNFTSKLFYKSTYKVITYIQPHASAHPLPENWHAYLSQTWTSSLCIKHALLFNPNSSSNFIASNYQIEISDVFFIVRTYQW